MTTTHDVPTQQPKMYRPQANPTPVTLSRVLSSESVKLRSLRSSWITMVLAVAGLVVVAIAGGILTNQDWSHMHPGELAHFEPIGQSLTGINFSQLAIGVLGVLFITGEYGTGMIRSTLAAAPQRLPGALGQVHVVRGRHPGIDGDRRVRRILRRSGRAG